MESIIKVRKLSKSFSTMGIQNHIIKNMDFEIYKDDFTVIMGNSGSGKSTLLYALSGMDKPTIGDIIFENETITNYTNDQLALFRRKNCGFVFQQIHLMDNMSVLDNVLSSGLLINRNKKLVAQKSIALLEKVGIHKELFMKFPSQLSGGEAQRVGIIRALINKPKLLFADEPTGALNSASGEMVLDILSDFHRNGQSIVMVTHDMKTALRGNRIVFLKDGTIVDEINLGNYNKEESQERYEKIRLFLDKMGW